MDSENKSKTGNWITNFFTTEVEVEVEKKKEESTSNTINTGNIASILLGNNTETPAVEVSNTIQENTISSEGTLNQEFLNKISEKLKAEDLEGPDMLELFEVVQDLMKEGSSLQDAVKTGFIALRSTSKSKNKLTKQIIDDSYQHYIKVINSDKTEFEQAFQNAMGSMVSEPTNKITVLQKEIESNKAEIIALENKNAANLKAISAVESDVKKQSNTLNQRKKDFNFTVNYFLKAFNDVYSKTSSLK